MIIALETLKSSWITWAVHGCAKSILSCQLGHFAAMVAVKLAHSNLAQHQAGIMKQMRNFWMEDHFCDLVLKGNDGAEHRAHTAVLSAASIYFKNLLSGSFLEANQVQQKQPVEIAASTTAVSALLDYIYGGQPEVILETGLELLRLAEAYDLPKFASEIEAGLHESLDSFKALRILKEAHGLHRLKATCEQKVAQDFETCSQHPDFGKLSAIQLARILKREDLNVSREEVAFKGIFNWFNSSKDRHGFSMLLLQVDFHAFSFENLLRLSRFTLSGSNGEDLHREVDEAQSRKRRAAVNVQDFVPKRRCLKHWTPDFGASAEAPGREVLQEQCDTMCWHGGHIYATDFQGNVLRWKPGDPATSARKVLDYSRDFGHYHSFSISPSGEIFVMNAEDKKLLRFQGGCEHLVCSDLDSDLVVCSPNGMVYVMPEREGVGL